MPFVHFQLAVPAAVAVDDGALEAALGSLHPASYVVVDELDAGAWGYDGRTQAACRPLPATA
jgi:hypothetical protein